MRLVALANLVVVAAIAAFTTPAFAENVETLPAPTKTAPLKFTYTSSTTSNVLEGESAGTAVSCEAAEGSGELISANSGSGSITLSKCKSPKNGAKCNSVGAGPGVIDATFDWHLVAWLSAGVLKIGHALSLLRTLVIECLTVKFEVEQTLIGILTKVAGSGAKTKEVTVTFAQAKGVQSVKECEVNLAFCAGRTFGLV